MSSESLRPKYLTKNSIKTLVESKDLQKLQTMHPILQVISVKDISKKKRMKTNKKIMLPLDYSNIICDKIDEPIGKPREYVAGEDFIRDFEPEIPYRNNVAEIKEEIDQELELNESDVEMEPHEQPPIKQEKSHSIKEEIKHDSSEVSIEETKEEKTPDKQQIIEENDQEDDEEDDYKYTPIKALSPLNSDWIIKARICKKFNAREWSNSRGSGRLLNIELIDRMGSKIQATFFNKAVDKFEGMIKEDKVYTFRKGMVKAANKKFTTIKNDYCLTFGPFSEIIQTENDAKISRNSFQFTKLSEIMKNELAIKFWD